jgi:hypothetical protein
MIVHGPPHRFDTRVYTFYGINIGTRCLGIGRGRLSHIAF